MKPLPSVLALGLSACLLASCNAFSPIPNDADIDVNGDYVGRLVGANNDSAVLDIKIVEKDLAVTGTVKSRATGDSYTLTGSRSVYRASPVTLNATANLGSGSGCPGGFTEHYGVQVTFYNSSRYSGAGGTGSVTHTVCVAGQMQPSQINSGQLELTRK